MEFSLGLGLTTECDLACAHCYRVTQQVGRLTYREVVTACDSIALRSVNLGTGENGLHPEFKRILEFLLDRDYKVSITSNGYSLAMLTDQELGRLHDVELSLDFPAEKDQDAFRAPGNWRRVMGAVERARGLGVETTITAVMMNVNYLALANLARLAGTLGANLRVNVYQPVQSRDYVLTYEQFWEGFRRLLAEADVIACTEPVVNAALRLPGNGSACGRTTVRVSPMGEVLPCVYWPFARLSLSDLRRLGPAIVDDPEFAQLHVLPPGCSGCEHVSTCAGGCGSRRALWGRMDEPDPYCPLRHPSKIRLQHRTGGARDLPKAASACTTIVRSA